MGGSAIFEVKPLFEVTKEIPQVGPFPELLPTRTPQEHGHVWTIFRACSDGLSHLGFGSACAGKLWCTGFPFVPMPDGGSEPFFGVLSGFMVLDRLC